MKRLPRFLKETSRSDYIAFIAALLSLYAIFQTHESNRPRVVLSQLSNYTYGHTEGGKDQAISLLRFAFSNQGGRAVSLISLEKDPRRAPALGIDSKGRQRLLERGFGLLYLDPVVGSRFEIIGRENELKIFSLDDGYKINKKIEPGEALEVNIVFALFSQRESDLQNVVLALKAVFSDGSTVPLEIEFDPVVRRMGR